MNPDSQNQPSGNPQNGQDNQYQEEQPQVVYMARPLEPQKQEMSQEARKRHEDSKRAYPFLNLSEGEYIILSVTRHPIGLVSIWGTAILVIVALFGAALLLANVSTDSGMSDTLGGGSLSLGLLLIPALLISMLALIFAFISSYIYNANHFYLTNESVIQHIQTSLFSKREQTVSLANVEDASYTQDGVVSHLFNYGNIRLSTQGDETTYRFSYVTNPQKQIAVLNNAVENFKNVRPIEH